MRSPSALLGTLRATCIAGLLHVLGACSMPGTAGTNSSAESDDAYPPSDTTGTSPSGGTQGQETGSGKLTESTSPDQQSTPDSSSNDTESNASSASATGDDDDDPNTDTGAGSELTSGMDDATGTGVPCPGERIITSERLFSDFVAEQCASLEGRLVLTGLTRSDLTGLEQLRSVGGQLSIHANHELRSLQGLDALEEISGGLRISRNVQLLRIDSLARLVRIEGELSIDHNARLVALDGLGDLVGVAASVVITENPALERLHGFRKLERVGGDLLIEANAAMTEIGGFEALEAIGDTEFPENFDDLSIVGNTRLERIDDFPRLRTISGEFRVTDNPELTAAGRQPALESVRSVMLWRNNALHTLDLPPTLTRAGHISISAEKQLWTVSGPTRIERIDGGFHIESLPQLERISGFDGLREISGDVRLSDLPRLDSMDWLSDLELIASSLSLVGLPRLKTIDGLASLHSIGGDFRIQECARLIDLRGLNRLNTIKGVLSVRGSVQSLLGLEQIDSLSGLFVSEANLLRDLSGLDGLEYVAGHVEIENTYSAEFELEGLEALRRIDGDFVSSTHATSLDALAGIESIGGRFALVSSPGIETLGPLLRWPENTVQGNLYIANNVNLPECQVKAFDLAQTHPEAVCSARDCTGNLGSGSCRLPPRSGEFADEDRSVER